MNFCELNEKEYEDFILLQKCGNFSQSELVKKTREANGNKVKLYGLKENNKVVAAGLFVKLAMPFGFYQYYSPSGFVMNFNNTNLLEFYTKSLKTELKKDKKCINFRIDPYLTLNRYENEQVFLIKENKEVINNLIKIGYIHNGFTIGQGKDNRVRWQYIIDLEGKNYEDHIISYNSTTKRYIKMAKKIGTIVREGNYEDLDIFCDILMHTAKRQNFQQKNADYFKNLYKNFKNADKTKILISELNLIAYKETLEKDKIKIIQNLEKNKNSDKIKLINELETNLKSVNSKLDMTSDLIKKYGDKCTTSASIFIFYNNECSYFHGGGYADLLSFHGQYLLQDEAINISFKKGMKRYNFMGISGDFKNDGLYHFKRGYNGEAIELIGQFDYPINKGLYTILNLLKKIKKLLRK